MVSDILCIGRAHKLGRRLILELVRPDKVTLVYWVLHCTMVWLAWIQKRAQIQFQKGKRFIGVIFQQYDISVLLSNTPSNYCPFLMHCDPVLWRALWGSEPVCQFCLTLVWAAYSSMWQQSISTSSSKGTSGMMHSFGLKQNFNSKLIKNTKNKYGLWK